MANNGASLPMFHTGNRGGIERVRIQAYPTFVRCMLIYLPSNMLYRGGSGVSCVLSNYLAVAFAANGYTNESAHY